MIMSTKELTTQERLQEQKTLLSNLQTQKANLLSLKKKGGDNWTIAKQNELDQIVNDLVDVQQVIDELSNAIVKEGEGSGDTETSEDEYKPKKGTENLVHVKVLNKKFGPRYDGNTGKEKNPPSLRMFTFGEWQNFVKFHKSIGFLIIEILYNPYAEQLAVTEDDNK